METQAGGREAGHLDSLGSDAYGNRLIYLVRPMVDGVGEHLLDGGEGVVEHARRLGDAFIDKVLYVHGRATAPPCSTLHGHRPTLDKLDKRFV